MAAKPSFTAFQIAKVITALGNTRKYRELVTGEQVMLSRQFADECSRYDDNFKLLHKLIGNKLSILLVDLLSVKGMPVHFAMRKKFIRKHFDRHADEISQVVVIGAGFDTLSLEKHADHPQVEFYELDQPQTQNVKKTAIAKMPRYGNSKIQNVHFIPCDLSKQKLGEILGADKFYNKSARTFFVIEGVLMYLDKEAVESLFKEIRDSSGKGSYVVFGSMDYLDANKDKRAIIADTVLSAKEEKYKFAMAVEDMPVFMKMNGFEVLETATYSELQEDVESAARIEKLQSQRGEHYYFVTKL